MFWSQPTLLLFSCMLFGALPVYPAGMRALPGCFKFGPWFVSLHACRCFQRNCLTMADTKLDLLGPQAPAQPDTSTAADQAADTAADAGGGCVHGGPAVPRKGVGAGPSNNYHPVMLWQALQVPSHHMRSRHPASYQANPPCR